MDYFTITGIELFRNVELKRDYSIIDFEVKNKVPLQYFAPNTACCRKFELIN